MSAKLLQQTANETHGVHLSRRFVEDLRSRRACDSRERGVLFDVGANTGSWSAKVMDRVAGVARGCRVDLVLIEPQPIHQQVLGALAAERDATLIEAAAWTHDTDELTFFHSSNSQAASLVASSARMATRRWAAEQPSPQRGHGVSSVRGVNLTRVLFESTSQTAGPVCLKLDVEGAEYSLLPPLLLSGALCRVDYLFVEWHLNSLPPDGDARLRGLALRHSLDSLLERGCRLERPSKRLVVHDENAYNNLGADVSGLARLAEVHSHEFAARLPSGASRWAPSDYGANGASEVHGDANAAAAAAASAPTLEEAAAAAWVAASRSGVCGVRTLVSIPQPLGRIALPASQRALRACLLLTQRSPDWHHASQATEFGTSCLDSGADGKVSSGAWHLKWWEVVSWQAAATACLRRCAECGGRCRHISVSLHGRDCSWYEHCGQRLDNAGSDHRSGRAVALAR